MIYISICLGFALAGAAIARIKGSSMVLWFVICGAVRPVAPVDGRLSVQPSATMEAIAADETRSETLLVPWQRGLLQV